MGGLFAGGGQVKADPALTLQPQQPLVEETHQQHGLVHVPQIGRRDGRLPLGVDDATLVVEDSDELELQGLRYYFASDGVVKAAPNA